MPTPKNKKVTPSRQSQWRRKSLWLVVVLLILAASGLGALVIQHNKKTKAIEADRARFSRVDKDVRSVASEIVKNTQPVQNEINQECTYQSRKFEAEPLICSVTFRALYGVSSLEQANAITESISGHVKSQPALFTFKSIAQKPTNPSPDGKYLFGYLPVAEDEMVRSEIFKSSITEMSCPLSYELFTSQNPPYYYRDYNIYNNYGLAIILDCSDLAQAEFFKTAD